MRIVRDMSDKAPDGKPLPTAPVVGAKPECAETLECVADEIGV